MRQLLSYQNFPLMVLPVSEDSLELLISGHLVDPVAESGGIPIPCRIPRNMLSHLEYTEMSTLFRKLHFSMAEH